MATWHKIAETAEFETDGDRVIREIEGVEIAVFRIEGDYHAIANYCIHQAGPLCDGELTGRVTVDKSDWSWKYDDTERYVLCPWHGWLFDVTTGKNVDVERYAVPTYNVEVRDGEIFIER